MLSPSQQLIRLGLGFMVSQALNVAADLNVADHLAAGARSVDDLAAETGCHAESLYRIMRILAAEGIFRETVDRHFELTELGSALRSDEPSSPRVASHILPLPSSAIPCTPAYRRSIKCSGSPGSIGWPTIPTRRRFFSML